VGMHSHWVSRKREGALVSQVAEASYGFTTGTTALVFEIAWALVKGNKAPDFSDNEVLTDLQAGEHDVQLVVRLLGRQKGRGIRVMLRALVMSIGLKETRQRLELRHLPAIQRLSHIKHDEQVFELACGDVVLRRFVFTADATRVFEYC
jgi:hypothetical protein